MPQILKKFGNDWSVYSESWFIQHLWDERVAEYCSFPHIRTLYITHMLVYVATNLMEISSFQLFP
jgi:hypothetical protein